MRWNELESSLLGHRDLGRWRTYGHVDDGAGRYPLLRFDAPASPGAPTCLVTAGFHGDEQAGPVTLGAHLEEIVTLARARDVSLVIYPCVNPSGFDAYTRYNRLGERPNNDALRYELADGRVVGELAAGAAFVRTHPHRGGPVETRALVTDLLTLPPPRAALDLHQDPYITGPLTYAYYFGDPSPYRALMAESAAHMAVARDRDVDVGVHTDADGLVVLHDGSVTDYFWRLGVPYAAVLETTTDADVAACDAINLIWLRGFIELCAAR